MTGVTGQLVPSPGAEQPFWTQVVEHQLHGDQIGVYSGGSPDLPPMVLVHGLEDSYRSWEPLARLISDRFRCFALDLPWRPGGNFEWRTRATTPEWIESALGLLPTPPVVIVAHSLGANSVLRWLEHPPGSGSAVPDPKAIVLLSPFYRAPSTPVNWVMFDRAKEDFGRVMSEGMRVRLGSRAHQMDQEVLSRMLEITVERAGPRGFVAMFDQFMCASRMSLGHIDIPTLVAASSDDPGISGERAAALAADLPIAEVRLYPDFTHFCHAEQTGQVAALMDQFLAFLAPCEVASREG